MSAVAIITARGGSKRIPGKNKMNFCGKPIICYSIEAALACGIFDENEICQRPDDKGPDGENKFNAHYISSSSPNDIRMSGNPICHMG